VEGGPTAAVETAPAGELPATPLVTETTAATEPAGAAVTEAATEAPDGAVTPAETGEAGAVTPTGEAAGDGGDGTPAASEGGFVRLSNLMNATVMASDGAQVGQVDGVLVEHPAPPPEEDAGEEAGAATAATTPTAEATAVEDTPVAEVSQFTARYLLLDVSANAGPADDEESGIPGEDTDAGTGSSTGSIVVVPWQAFTFEGDSAALTIDSGTLASAPHLRLTDIAGGGAAWHSNVASYWEGQGIAGLPVTGADPAAGPNLALVPRDFRGILVAGAEGEDFGSVNDFIIDPATGEIAHVVVSGGEAFNDQLFVVPISHLTWTAGTGGQLGSFTFNFPADTFQNAPSFQDLDSLQLDEETVGELESFWSSVQ
jgi:sporulation protein YlmC with PRC-barrel domain